MARLHLFEIHGLRRCPSLLRRIATEYLRTVGEVFHAFDPVVPLLAELVRASGTRTIVDLNPEQESLLHAQTKAKVPVRAELEPVDARAVPERLQGVRTLFDAFHHFRPADARRILADASARRVPLLVVEATERSFAGVVGMVLFVPLLVLALTPFVRPFSFWRLLALPR